MKNERIGHPSRVHVGILYPIESISYNSYCIFYWTGLDSKKWQSGHIKIL